MSYAEDLPKVMFPDGEQAHKATEIIDALQNLLYLIRLDASKPAQVADYAEHAETLLLKMREVVSENAGRKANATLPSGKAKVLVVDDDSAVVKTLAIVFRNAGYESRMGESAEQVLAMLKIEEWVPQLALIDVHLPGMNGIDLAILLKAQIPALRVCLFSGRAETNDLVEEARRRGHLFPILPKPVHPTVFLGMAATVMGAAGQSIDTLE